MRSGRDGNNWTRPGRERLEDPPKERPHADFLPFYLLLSVCLYLYLRVSIYLSISLYSLSLSLSLSVYISDRLKDILLGTSFFFSR